MRDGVYVLDRPEAAIVFDAVAEEPVPSLLRDFSARVKLDLGLTDAQRMRLLAQDSDPFNRWQAAQDVALRLILDPDADRTEAFAAALGRFLDGEALADPAFAALVLALPSEGEAADAVPAEVDPDAIHRGRSDLRTVSARSCGRGSKRSTRRSCRTRVSLTAPTPPRRGAGRSATPPST